MKKLILLLAMVFFFTERLLAGLFGITFTFENGVITGTSPKYYEFDIFVVGTTDSKIGSCEAYVDYNGTGFGNSVVGNGKITATRGTLVSSGAVYSGPQLNDNTATKVSITIDYTSGDPSFGSDLGTSPQQWAHVKMEIADPGVTAGLSFDETLMGTGACYLSDNATQYNPVVATDADDASLPVQFAGISATVAAGEGITLTWQTESEVDSYGFNVWRSAEREGTYVKLTTQAIPSAGNTSSRQEYTFTDTHVQAGEEYWYKVEELSLSGASTFYGPIRAEGTGAVPDAFALSSNYPNPFNPETSFSYDLPQSAPVRIAVYSLIGQEIATLVEGTQEAGHYTMKWDGRDASGRPVSSGIYFLRMEAGAFHRVGKMTLLR